MTASSTSITDSKKILAPAARSGLALSQKQLFWRQFRRHKLALVAAAVLAIVTLLVILAPWIAPYAFDTIDPLHARQPPSAQHWMGSDDLGRHLFTRLLYGAAHSRCVCRF